MSPRARRSLGAAAACWAWLACGCDRPEDRSPGEPSGTSAAACADLTPAAARGRRIFRRGVTASGRPIEGTLGGGATLSGREAACAGCHSLAGAGSLEGGVAVPPITPEQLFAAQGSRGPYTAATLATAIREGRSPTRDLHLLMPRYRLDAADLDDLTAYLRCLGHDRDPGTSADALKLGAALPLTGPLASAGAAVRDVLAASLAEVNAQGGIFRRRLDLVVEDSGGGIGEERATERLLGGDVLALVGSAWSGRGALEARVDAEEIPVIGPVSAAPPPASRAEGAVFQVEPGLDWLARVAIKHLAGSPPLRGATGVLVIHPSGPAGDGWLRGARAEASARGLPEPASLAYGPGPLDAGALRERLRGDPPRAVLFSGAPDDLARLTALIDTPQAPAPALYAPASLLPDALAAPGQARLGRVLFIHAGLLDGAEPRGRQAFSAFLERHGIPPRHLALQRRAALSVGLLVEALKRTGAHVTRHGLLAALESLRDFDAGYGPPITFGRNRRVGVAGGSLIRVDPASRAVVPASAWIGVVP